MDKKKLIEQEVEKTLQCFDQAEKIKSNSFFFTRVQAAISGLDRKQTRSKIRLLLRPAFIAGIVILNLVTAAFILSKKGEQTRAKARIIYSLAEEYSFTQKDYDIFKIKEPR